MNHASNLALQTRDGRLFYWELTELADEIAGNVPGRSVVFLIATNTIAAIAGYAGFLRKRAVVVMIRTGMTQEQLDGLLCAYEPQFIWCPDKSIDSMAGFALSSVFSYDGYSLLSTGHACYKVNPDTALLLTTSGSTGTPKYVRLTYANLRSNAESIAEYQQISEFDRAITTLPFSYSYGISIVNSHLLRGASLVLTEEGVLSHDFWDLLKDSGVTNFGGVPYTYQMLKRLHFNQMDLPSLRFISQAGGRLGANLQSEFGQICREKGIDFFVMYGQTEATARMSWLPPEYVLDKLGSIGQAIPGGQFELRDDAGKLINDSGVAGELYYQGANVSQGYALNKDDLANADENFGILATGDIARRDEDGFYYIIGRMKRFLKLFGNRINMDELEAMIAKHGIEIACVGVDDKMTVFTTYDNHEALISILAKETGINPHGFAVQHLEEIPRTSSGKTDYASLELSIAK